MKADKEIIETMEDIRKTFAVCTMITLGCIGIVFLIALRVML